MSAEGMLLCPSCGQATQESRMSVTMWSGNRLVLIENVPTRVCDHCQEQLYDELTSSRIMQLAASGFPSSRALREITVPVFSLEDARPGDADKPTNEEEGKEP
jgi:YgiT-type zinc finger domain-containing protein